LKQSAVVVDVGINRVDGQLYGDARPGLPVAMQTPVPGGVGLLTRLALISNVWEAYAHGI
jgi:methylenetetrahydrofolate dehydrogenase (NADP+)/methenyltetrahydrofolate cyclohydrolase